MKIIDTFVHIRDSLFAVQFEGYTTDEFRRIFGLWNDPEYLESFFEEHKTDLQNNLWGKLSVEDAILRTRKNAKILEKKILETAKTGQTSKYETLSTLFKPLYNNPTKLEEYELNKAYGLESKSWLRIYAVRKDVNNFVVSGGAIKLTKTMNEREHLQQELLKLKAVKAYLMADEDEQLEFIELA